MDTIDKQKAARVWERVQGRPVRDPGDLPALIAGEWSDAAIYLQLSRRFQGKESAALRRLYEQEQAHAACLKGIYTLLTGAQPAVPTVTPALENTEAALRRCYGREMRCLAQYEARQTDPQYGHVFRSLSRQEQEHCHKILEILGVLAK